ncbi:tyrosine-type recombinase/integrase [Nocardia gipuzkoensis]|uniref:tyrosine-type recombinase/integrase n=1 Tax=Nocardia gipuzkoensis TaxID=2749991 RepID=UPI00237DD360|nr:site-specific integrase [Nocardia gipuzkoensis]MDE1673737.1 site-specific integrase [Nocardia gipuzkoensis]
MDMVQRDGRWITTVEVSAENQNQLNKRVAAVKRLLKKMDAEKRKARRANGEGTIFKRADGMHVGRLELEPGPDGKRRRSKPVYGKDEATVVLKLQKLRQDIASGIGQLDRTMTVEQWLRYWLEEIAKTQLRPHAWRSYRSAVNTRIIPAIGPKRLADLEPKDVRFMHRRILSSTYRSRDKESNEVIDVPYSTRSVEEAHSVLSAALNAALAEGGLVPRNVAEFAKKPPVLSQSHGDLTSEQARAVLLAAHSGGDRMVTRWAAGLMLGGRQGELLGLQWDRVDLELGTLDLCWQLEWLKMHEGADQNDPKRFDVPAGFEYIPLWRGAALTRPKTDKSRRLIPLPEPLAAILTVYRQTWEPNPWDLVWTNKRGKRGVQTPIGDHVDAKGWAAAQKRAKIAKPVDVHAMRGTTATLLMEAGVDAKVIQSILGHASVITTRGYQRVDLSLSRIALGNLDGLLQLD